MARQAVTIVAALVTLGIGVMFCLSLAPLFLSLHGDDFAKAHIGAALRFTLLQALLSALLSCLMGAVLARALFRRRFWGRGTVIRAISAPFLLPSLAAVMGLLIVFGRSGVVNTGLSALGLPNFSVYGLFGVVLAHVFLNLPLAGRMVLQGWHDIPSERFRLAQSLRFGPKALFWHLEWPMLRMILPSAFAAIFLVCLSSFAVALILGGGPRASTVELAIYQSLRFQFDLDLATSLSLVQLAIGLAALLLAALLWRPLQFGAGLDRPFTWQGPRGLALCADTAVIAAAVGFFALPMGAVVVMGLGLQIVGVAGFGSAAMLSVFIAVAAAGLATSMALALAWARAKGAGPWTEGAAMGPLCVSGLVLGTGMYLALRPMLNPQTLGVPMAILFGAALSLPFLYRILLPGCKSIIANHARLSAQVRLSPWAEVRWVAVPRLSRQIGFCLGVSAALSMGDLGVLALFGAPDQVTLPILIARLMGSYQMDAAATVTLALVALSFSLFWLFDTWGARHART